MTTLEIIFATAIVILTAAVVVLAVQCGYLVSELEDVWSQIDKLQNKSKCPNLTGIYKGISLEVNEKIKNLSDIVKEIRRGMKK